MKRIFIILWIPALLCCVSLKEKEQSVKALNDVYIGDIEKKIDAGQYSKAVQDIFYLESIKTEVPVEELEALKGSALDKLAGAFNKKAGDKDYLGAMQIYQSLENLGMQGMVPGWTENRLWMLIAEKYYAENNPLCALLAGIKLLDSAEVNPEDVQKILDIAYESQNRSALRIILKAMDRLGLKADEKYRVMAAVYPSKTEMMKGTAIIWVDMGIRLEKGMGLPERALGSGFFIDKRGYLLTNHHVIKSEVDPKYEGYSRLYVRLSRDIDQKIPTKVVGYDRIFDLALLKVEVTPEFVFNSVGSPEVTPGDNVFAIGSPIDPFLQNTITAGIVSATGRRKLLQMGDMVQIDAPVNPGNSGGPLIDEKNGELIGIVFAGLEYFEGLNFAITYNWVNKMISRLFAGGEVKHPWLGLALDETEHGLQVIYSLPGEAGARSGIREGDILLTLNGKSYTTIRDIQEALLDFVPDTLVKVTWKRQDTEYMGVLSLTERPFSPIELALERDLQSRVFVPLFGMGIERVNNFLWQTNYRVTEVVPGSAADNIGLSINDPLSIQGWHVDKDDRVAFLQIYVKKRKAGFFETFVQLAGYLETDEFI